MKPILLAMMLALSCTQGHAIAQSDDYPNRPVTFVVPFPPGGGVDILTRLIASKLSWRAPPIIVNRAGGGSVIGTDSVARSAPDGYTLLMTAPPFTTNAALMPKLPYDPLRDFVPVMLATSNPLIVVVHPTVPARSVQELITLARSQPGKMSYGSSGNGGPQHLAAELFKATAQIDITHVPYKGSAPAIADLVGGHVAVGFSDMMAVMGQVKDGRLRALAVTSPRRSPVMPELPAVAEALAGYQASTWTGLFARAGTPPHVIARINADVAQVLRLPEIRDKLAAEGADLVASDPATFEAFVKSEIEKVVKLSKVATIKLD